MNLEEMSGARKLIEEVRFKAGQDVAEWMKTLDFETLILQEAKLKHTPNSKEYQIILKIELDVLYAKKALIQSESNRIKDSIKSEIV